LAAQDGSAETLSLRQQLERGQADLNEAIAFVKGQPGVEYMDLHGRKLVDAAIDVIVGYLFLRDARHSEAKAAAARRWVTTRMPRVRLLRELIETGDRSTMTEFELLAAPVPEEE
jgi:hypothetical protein